MNIIAKIFETPLALGSTVSIPILLFIICLVVRVPVLAALKTSVSSGFCLVGMSVLIGRFGQMLADLAASMLNQNTTLLPVADAGRRAALAIASVSEIGVYIMPLAIVVNIIMLLTRSTRTINIDMWSFWLFAFVGAMVETFTGQLGYGLVAAVLAVVFTLVVADSSVKGVEKCCAMHSVTFTNAITASYAPIAGLLCWLVDLIPFKGKKKDITFGWLQKRIGYLGDPVLIGTVIMAAIGIWNGMDWITALQTAVQVGAYIFIVPKIMLLMGDSLRPMAMGLDKLSREKLHLHGNLRVGLSSLAGLGNPTAMLISVLMVPVTIGLAEILPGNSFAPSMDFSMLPYMFIAVVAICRGGIFRSVISSLLTVIVMLYSSTAVAGLFTQAAVAADPATYGTLSAISGMYGGGSPLVLLAAWMSSFGFAGISLMVVCVIALCFWNFNKLNGNVKIYVKKQKAYRTFAIENLKEQNERRRELRSQAVSKKREQLRQAVETDKIIREIGIGTMPGEVVQLSIFERAVSQQDVVDAKVAEVAETTEAAKTPQHENGQAAEHTDKQPAAPQNPPPQPNRQHESPERQPADTQRTPQQPEQ